MTPEKEQERKFQEVEREKFLSALLSSVSHDFKTPLVTVIGALSSLKDMEHIQNHFESREVVAGALEEAQKLNRFINNVMEISRLESRSLTVKILYTHRYITTAASASSRYGLPTAMFGTFSEFNSKEVCS